MHAAATGMVLLCALAGMLTGCGGGGDAGDEQASAHTEAVAAETVSLSPASVPVNVSALPATWAYQAGDMLFLERAGGGEVSRIGVDTRRGGMITEASLNGVNVVNAHDTGRAVQLALYDGAYAYDACAGCTGGWGWNPVQGGDHQNRGSGALSARIDSDGVTVRTRPLEWMPPGGDIPVASDVVIEQRISAVHGDVRAFRVDFRIELEGGTLRQAAMQELPAAYAGAQYQRLVTYSGTAPWTNGEATAAALLPLGQTPLAQPSAERWFSLVDPNDFGLTVFAPGSHPMVRGFIAPGGSGPTGTGAAFARLDAPFAFSGGQTIVGHYYLMVGDYKRARQTIYRVRE